MLRKSAVLVTDAPARQEVTVSVFLINTHL